MIQIICGREGTGKTKNLIDMANNLMRVTDGHIVYVDIDHSHMHNLSYNIRLVNADDYPLDSNREFFGFVCGILSQDYDIKTIFIDGLLKNAKIDPARVDTLIHKIESVSVKNQVDFIISVCAEAEELPESVRGYIV